MMVVNSSILCNSSPSGGGLYVHGSTKIYNSIIALNQTKDVDVYRSYDEIEVYNVLTSDVTEFRGDNVYEYDPNLPLFEDVESGDYRLVRNSQAIDLGNDNYTYSVGLDEESKDLAGKPRFVGNAVDVGAYEYDSYIASEQKDVWVGDVSFDLTSGLHGASKVAVKWESGVDSGNVGIFDLPCSFTLDTTQYSNGPFNLKIDWFDASNGIVLTEEKTATIINDESIVVKRGEIRTDDIWNPDKVYIVVGKLSVASGANLTIGGGTIVKFWKGARLDVSSAANVYIKDDVVFTRAEDDEVVGDTNKDGGASLPQIGGSYYRGDGLGGVSIGDDVVFKYMTQTRQGIITNDETWLSGVYRITGDLTIAKGATLTLASGSVLKFDPGCSLIVEQGGKLIAKGNAAQPIIFTSLYDDEYGGDVDEEEDKIPNAGDWKQILVCGVAEFDYVRVLYSGSDPNNSSDGAIFAKSGGRVVFNNGVIAHSELAAAHCDQSSSFEANSSIITEAMYGTHNGNYKNCTFNSLTYLCNTNYYYYTGNYINCVIADVANNYYSGNTPGYKFNHCLFWNPVGVGPQSFNAVGQNGNFWANPIFRDVANGDYRLRAGSPCIDAGTAEGAPETDADGIGRFDDSHMDNNGNSYVDIGAYEFVPENAESDVDLDPIFVAASTQCEVGGRINVQWTVRNNGSQVASCAWRDRFYLVSADGARVEIGDVLKNRYIVPGDVETYTAELTVPSVTPGDWKIAVTV
ncbi:MAG: hypothetical protein J6X44_07190, partial [Thermoguttaceae bacterium]|nr:hypothetical protein [Thermoguttaceae bacterium]